MQASVPAWSASAGLLSVLGLATLIAAGVAALALVLPVWAAAVIVAVVLFVAAGIAALFSRKQAAEIAPPATESVESVKADIKEVKEARSWANLNEFVRNPAPMPISTNSRPISTRRARNSAKPSRP